MLENLRNIGIIAHVDAGKTTTTERILYFSGSKHKIGDVDEGNTTTDFDPLEKQKGITINSAAVMVEWGDKRIVDTPISEAGFIGMGIGASMLGVRPVMELMFWSFHSVAFDQLVNNAACVRYMSGGLINCPIVMRGPANGGTNVGATHSHIPEGLFAAFPGLKVVAPATPADAKGLIKAAIRDPNPVMFFMDLALGPATGDVPEGDHVVPIGEAAVRRTGRDVTLVSYAKTVGHCLEAAGQLAGQGISAEVIDLRTLKPIDGAAILRSA